jgi:predicted methyltransferase
LNDCQSIKERLAFSNDEFHEVIIFLQKQQMIELNNNKIRITSKGKTFLALPH